MTRQGGSHRATPGDDRSQRIDAHLADEAELGMLLEQVYAARAAHAAPPEEMLARLDATLDRGAPPPRRRTDHSRVFGARAFAALLVLLVLSSVGLSRLAIDGHTTTPLVAPSAPIAVSQPANVATVGRDDAARGTMPSAPASPQAAGASETPLRDLLERAGIHATSPPGASTTERHPPLN